MIHQNPIPDSYYHPVFTKDEEHHHKCVCCESMFVTGIQIQREEKFCSKCAEANDHLTYYRDVLEVEIADIYRITTEEVEAI